MTQEVHVSSTRDEVSDVRGIRAVMARLMVVTLVLGALAMATTSSPAGAAAATVNNGLSTADLAAAGMSPSTLASALVGPGVTVSNVTYSGANAQAGTIHVVDPAVVSFNDGVILSSGNIADVVGPNKSDGTTGDMAGPADADLTALIANTQTVNPMTYDAASLEFDFVPTASQVYFTYTFASDEYLEWVNLFNDVFAFYVNGHNCATVPNGDPVSIDTINSAVNPQLFRDNSYSSPPANPINFESDGLSVEMICSATVNAGQTNHMKLAIADTSDQILDSVVMLKAQSLSTVPPEACNDSVDNDDDTLVDDQDPSCQATTTPPPVGQGGVGSSGNAPAFTGNEGTPIPLDAAALEWTPSADTITTEWSVTGINGTSGTCTISPAGPQPIGPDGSVAVVTATCPDDGEYVARVDGTDVEGSSSWDTDVDFFVHNAPPAVTIDTPTMDAQVNVGDAVELSATVVDPGASDTVTCTIDWGDGTTEAGALNGSTCSGSHAYSATGTPIVTVTGTDDAGDSSAAATVLAVVDASTTLSSSANPSVTGQSVVLSATTTLGTTGTMRFYDGATLLGTKAVSGGSAALATTKLAVGTHSLTASYAATSTSTPVVTAPLDQQVDPASTTTALSSTVNPSVNGQLVTIKAKVTAEAPGGGVPTGTVDLYDDGTFVATRTMSGGTASFAVRPGFGVHGYTATYNGSANHLGSSSIGAFAQTVDQAATTTTITSNVNPSVSGQMVGIRTTVKTAAPGSGTPSGSVDLYEGGALVGTRTLANGATTFSLRLGLGTHTFTAVYSGSTSHLGSSTSSGFDQTVNPAATTTTVTSNVNPSVSGQAVSIRATVRAAAPGSGYPTGTVDIYDDGTLVATKALTNGVGAVSLKPSVGTHSYTATYSGSAGYTASSSTSALSQVVGQAASKVTLSSTYPTTTAGHAGTIKATVTAMAPGTGVPTGTVQIFEGDTLLGTFPVIAGKASMPIASLPVGVHTLTAAYSGSTSFTPSLSEVPLIQTIT